MILIFWMSQVRDNVPLSSMHYLQYAVLGKEYSDRNGDMQCAMSQSYDVIFKLYMYIMIFKIWWRWCLIKLTKCLLHNGEWKIFINYKAPVLTLYVQTNEPMGGST